MVRLSKSALLTLSIFAGYTSLIPPRPASAADGSTTNIAIDAATLHPSVKRLGINLSYQTFYDSGQILKNLASRNPGFEGEIYQSAIRCASGSASGCVDDNPYSAWPDGFWTGATAEFFFGRAIGRRDTVTAYARVSGSTGGRFTFASGSGAVPATGDYMIVRKSIPGNATAGWWVTTTGSGAVNTTFTDLPPGTAGLQAASVAAPGAGDVATVGAYFDSTAGRSFLALNGTYQISFKAKGAGGSNSIGLNVQRAGLPAYLTQTVKLTSAWSSYAFTFNAAESGSAIGAVGLLFTARGSSFLLDDVSFTQLNTDPSNATAFRDPVVKALKTLNPGVIRFWANQLGDGLDNMIAAPYARLRSGYTAWGSGQGDISYSLPEFLELCAAVGAEPWVVIPATFSTAEAANLIEYLSGSTSTPYGARRAAAGRSASWVASFGKIHLEFGNEAWNGGFKGGSIEYSAPYGQRAQALFAAMRSHPAFVSSHYDLALGGQAVWPSRNQDIQNNCNNNDTFALAPYMMNTVDSHSTNEDLYGSTFAEGEAFHSDGGTAEGIASGLVAQNIKAIQASSHPVPLTLYEMNLSTTAGSIPQAALNAFAPSLGAGLGVVNSMLQQMRQGILLQNLYALQQFQFLRPDGKTVPLWGSVVDMGVTDRKRPQFLAMQLVNEAIGSNASMLKTTHGGADPTWNQPLVNSVQLTGAHYLQSFAFSSGSQRSLVVLNLHRTSSLPVTFIGQNAPFGSVRMQQLTAASISDTNEDSAKVAITGQTLGGFNASAGVSLPPHSMTLLTWSGGASPSPVITSVSASAVSGTSATIRWTTNEPATTQVRYGSTAEYGSLSPNDTNLVSSHAMVLTGLNPGTTYNFSAQSANALGLLAASPNLTFFTPTTGPLISAVSVSGITGTSATVNWTTDKPSSSRVSYGPTAAYGAASALDPALVTAHSVTLTGLTPGATYRYAATSALPAGSTTSGDYSFATPATGLVISAVAASGLTSTSATISWTTDKPSSSQAVFGTSAAYGSYSSYLAALVTAHSVTVNGLTPGTTYHYAVTSVSPTGSATSSNFTFATPGNLPVITGVAAGGVTATTAVVTWTTDKPSSSQVAYGLTAAYGANSAFNAALETSHSVTLANLATGKTYNYSVISVAPGGTATSANFTFATVGSAPVIGAVTATAIGTTSATITWTTDKPSSTLVSYGPTTAYGVYSALNPALESYHSVTLTGLNPDATYQYAVTSAGSGGTATSANYSFSTSGAAPVLATVSVSSITATSALVTWSTDKPSSSQVSYGTTTAYGSSSSFDASPVTWHSVALTGLASGATYHFAVSSVASAKSSTSGNFTFSTVSGAPVISGVTAAGVTNTSAVISWTTDRPSSSQVGFGPTAALGSYSANNPALITAHSVTLTGLNPGTTYRYAATSAAAGGTATSAAFTFSTSSSAPTITLVSATSITGSSATITWSTDQASSSQVSYGATAGYGSNSNFDPALVTWHSVTLTGLAAGTTYHYKATSAAAGGTAATGDFTFTTPGGPPVITSVAATSIGTGSATITWLTDQPSGSQVAYGPSPGYGATSSYNPALVTYHSVTLTGLAEGATYHYAVNSAGSGGSSTSGNFAFTTTTGALAFSSVSATAISGTSATITWLTSSPSTSQVIYGLTAGYGGYSNYDSTPVTWHSVTLNGLTPGRAYNFAVVSWGVGGRAASTNFLFATPSAGPAISAVSASASTNTAVIRWTTDVPATGQVTFGGSPAYGSYSSYFGTLLTGHSIILTGLSPGTTYNYQALSSDSSGRSTGSPNLTFTTAR